MKTVTETKGLRDIRTAISSHTRSTSRHKGTPYLEILSLGMEKLRLSTELSQINDRVGRIEARLNEIGQALRERLTIVAEEVPSEHGPGAEAAVDSHPSEAGPKAPRGFKSMKVEY